MSEYIPDAAVFLRRLSSFRGPQFGDSSSSGLKLDEAAEAADAALSAYGMPGGGGNPYGALLERTERLACSAAVEYRGGKFKELAESSGGEGNGAGSSSREAWLDQ